MSLDSWSANRVNFITIQHAQGISSVGYTTLPLRTGYERVISQRTSDLFATTAQQAGVVKNVTAEAISVEYADGSVANIQLGRRFGSAAGSVYPHQVTTTLKKGETFKPGKTIAYNSNFFTPDPLDPNAVLWKGGIVCKTAFIEANDTFEDSSVISEEISKKLGTGITHVRHLFFNFEQTVRNLIEVGAVVDSETILCTIEDAVTADNDLFTADTLETLKLLSGNTPRAKYAGHVEKIEVFYFGDLEDMTPTLKEIAVKADKLLAKECRALNKPVVTGSMTDSIRVDNTVLQLDNMVVKVYITEIDGAGVGD